MIKRIGLFLTVTLLSVALSACCFGPHRGGGGQGHYYNHY